MPEIEQLLPIVVTLIVAGGLVGLLAGLFGVGGGGISVPVFYEMLQRLGYPEDVAMPLAVGTSLAVIVPTSLSAARGHYLRGALDTDILRRWAVPITLGVLAGAVIARFAEPEVFQIAFVLVAVVNAAKLLTGGKGWRLGDGLPGPARMSVYGGLTGLFSSLMGVGGGAISNLFMTLHGVPMHRAIATSAGVGALITLPGTLGYILAGWGKPGLPPDALGYVSLLTMAAVIPSSLLTTRLGVLLAHRLTRRHLEIGFGLFLLTVASRFVWELLT